MAHGFRVQPPAPPLLRIDRLWQGQFGRREHLLNIRLPGRLQSLDLWQYSSRNSAAGLRVCYKKLARIGRQKRHSLMHPPRTFIGSIP